MSHKCLKYVWKEIWLGESVSILKGSGEENHKFKESILLLLLIPRTLARDLKLLSETDRKRMKVSAELDDVRGCSPRCYFPNERQLLVGRFNGEGGK